MKFTVAGFSCDGFLFYRFEKIFIFHRIKKIKIFFILYKNFEISIDIEIFL